MESSADVSDGPVLNFVNKRIRGLRKKLNRIIQIEEAIDQGKAINKEQEELIRSKPSISASIDELEKLRQPLSAALAEEIVLAIQRHQVSSSSSPVDTDPIDDKCQDKESEKKMADADAESQQQDRENSSIEDLLYLLYFGAMFDVKSQNDFTSMMFTQMHERGSCLTYDYVTDDESAEMLVENDLDQISKLSGLLISRPIDSSLSHKNALQHCVEHAKLWIANCNQPIDSFPGVTYAGLRAKLNKIMASDYFTTTPKMKPTVEMAAANYGSFQIAVPVQVESQDEDGAAPIVQGNECGGQMEESQKIENEFEDSGKEVSSQREVAEAEGGEGESKEDQKQRQYSNNNRRGYGSNQNQRGGGGGGGGGRSGGRRGGGGYGGNGSRVGRGGGAGPYQNGRSSQFYDEAAGNSYYAPRNYYSNNNNRPRGGGRGGGGGGRGGGNINHGGAVNQTRYVQADA